ncbi:unnamed protein product [Discula destructiva]
MLDNIHGLSIYIPGIFNYTSDSDDDVMGPSTSDSRRSNGMSRRDSTRSHSAGRRPGLLRSSTPAPSITPSTASRNGLASPQDTRRATDLLHQISSSPPNPASPLSQSPSSLYEGPSSLDSLPVNMDSYRPHLESSDRYFSFPSPDTWEPDQSDQEREPGMKSP